MTRFWPFAVRVFQSTPSARRATSVSASRKRSDFIFQSTPSARRATHRVRCYCNRRYDFNPRPPRGERRHKALEEQRRMEISIHALREEGDAIDLLPNLTPEQFQSTPSARRATLLQGFQHPHIPISIHALREEGDRSVLMPCSSGWRFQSTPSARRATSVYKIRIVKRGYFNPRPPRGGRLKGQKKVIGRYLFQSTPSARRATILCFPALAA